MTQGYGEYFMTGQNGYGGFGGYGAFGDAASDAQTIYNQMLSGDSAGATTALTALSTSQGAAYASSVCQQMGQIALSADSASAAQTGTATQQSQNAVISVCQAAGISTGAATSTQVQTLFQQLQQGGSAAVIQALLAMDATTRANTCNQLGQLAYAADVAAATATSTVAYTNQNAVISACQAAGVTMPAPGGTTPPSTTPVVAASAMSGTSMLLLGAVGIGILYFVFK